jgi:hypothetical protein
VITQGMPLLIFCAIMTFVIIIALMCYKSVARTVPVNYILLTAFTVYFRLISKICKAIIVSFSCALSKPELVLMAAVMTAGINYLIRI